MKVALGGKFDLFVARWSKKLLNKVFALAKEARSLCQHERFYLTTAMKKSDGEPTLLGNVMAS